MYCRDLGMADSLFARLDDTGATYELNMQYRMNRSVAYKFLCFSIDWKVIWGIFVFPHQDFPMKILQVIHLSKFTIVASLCSIKRGNPVK